MKLQSSLWVRGLAGIALVWFANGLSWWWVTFVVGALLVVGVAPRGRAFTLAAAVGLGGWLAPLAWLSLSTPVGRATTVLSSLMGYTFGPMALLLTGVVGLSLSLCGAWLARALLAYRS
jgi:hypothetical protein